MNDKERAKVDEWLNLSARMKDHSPSMYACYEGADFDHGFDSLDDAAHVLQGTAYHVLNSQGIKMGGFRHDGNFRFSANFEDQYGNLFLNRGCTVSVTTNGYLAGVVARIDLMFGMLSEQFDL